MTKMFPIVLVAAGILALAYGAVNYSEQTHEANVGPLDITVALGAVGGGLLVRRTLVDKGDEMSVAKVSEISATSSKSFEDALKQGIARANKTLRNVRSAWVKEQQVHVNEGLITEYQVNMMVTFVIDD